MIGLPASSGRRSTSTAAMNWSRSTCSTHRIPFTPPVCPKHPWQASALHRAWPLSLRPPDLLRIPAQPNTVASEPSGILVLDGDSRRSHGSGHICARPHGQASGGRTSGARRQAAALSKLLSRMRRAPRIAVGRWLPGFAELNDGARVGELLHSAQTKANCRPRLGLGIGQQLGWLTAQLNSVAPAVG